MTNNFDRLLENMDDIESFKIGDILYSSWGHEQTNIDWYKVTKMTDKSITVRQVNDVQKSDGPQTMTGTSKPGNRFISKPFRKKISPYIKHEHGYLKKWDGTPKRYSTYG